RSRTAARILARRYCVSPRRQSHVRRLSAGATLLGHDVPGALSAGTRHCRRPAGGARGVADHDGCGVQLVRRRVRPLGAGTPALGAIAVTFLAIDRPEPAQCVVCMVDRSRTLVADDLSSIWLAALGL